MKNSKVFSASVNSLKSKIARLEAEIWAIENKTITNNAKQLVEEVINLVNCCGEGFREGDYYAQTRYYSNIQGVKNIRQYEENVIYVKVTSPIGLLLPEKITIKDKTFLVKFCFSNNFSETVNY